MNDDGIHIGFRHDIRIGRLDEREDGAPAVCLANDGDNFYTQYFVDPEELDAFINELQRARVKLWG